MAKPMKTLELHYPMIDVAVGDSQEFQEVSRPVSWSKDYLTGS